MMRLSRTAVFSAAWAACCTKTISLVSRDTMRPGVSRVSRAKSAVIKWRKATFCMSVVMRVITRLVDTVCR